MSRQVLAHAPGRDLWVALAGVVFCDFIGVLFLSLGGPGWVVGLAVMLLGGPYSAWLALEAHPRRRTLTRRIGIGNALVLVVAAIALVAFTVYMLLRVPWG